MQPIGGYNQGYNNEGYNNQNAAGYEGQQQYDSPPGALPSYGGGNDGYYGQETGVAQPGNVYQPGGYK